MQRQEARQGSVEAVTAAIEANRALVDELQVLEQSLASEEARLVTQTQEIRHRMALRRAKQAMDALFPKTTRPAASPENYEKVKPLANGVVPRSFIRQQPSFFSDEQTKRGPGRPKKKQKKDTDQAPEGAEALKKMVEPPPNADTKFLRAHSHESFLATPPSTFTPKERKVVKEFAEEYCSDHRVQEIPLEAWNGIRVWQMKKSKRQLPIDRSGFACKLWYELHEAPQLRVCAWTKQEDAALLKLATGKEDLTLVNNWSEIAKRMPIPGRPPVHCLIRYQTTLCGDNVRSSFTPEEDKKLRDAVGVFGEKWNIIADLMDGRLSEQLRHRWQLTLAPGLRQGKFSVVEDRRILLALRAYVPKDSDFSRDSVPWNDVSRHVPGRTQPALRDRFINSLNPELSFRKWSKQEDMTILSCVNEWGIDAPGLWTRLASELGDRTDSQVARRWRSLAPAAAEQRRQILQEASKHQTSSVFRRPTIHRRSNQAKTEYAKRSTYDARASGDNGDGQVGPKYERLSVKPSHISEFRLLERRPTCLGNNMEVLSVNATSMRRTSLSSRGASRSSTSRSLHTQFKMDEDYSSGDNQRAQPQSVATNTKATRCYRPKEWSPEAEEAFRVQQTGWRDIKEYMESYGEPERWHNGFVRCTRVKSNGYYTYWRPHRECDDKYLHTVKLFEYE